MNNRHKIVLYFDWDKIGIKKIVCLCGMIYGVLTGIIMIVLAPSNLYPKRRMSILDVVEGRVMDNKPTLQLIFLYIGIIVVFFILAIVSFLIYRRKPSSLISDQEFDKIKGEVELENIKNGLNKIGVNLEEIDNYIFKSISGYILQKINLPVLKRVGIDGKFRSSLCQTTFMITVQDQIYIFQCTYSLINGDYEEKQFVFNKGQINSRVMSENKKVSIKSKVVNDCMLKIYMQNDNIIMAANCQSDISSDIRDINACLA